MISLFLSFCRIVPPYFPSYPLCHRDLKPENLLMTGKDDSADLKLVDFGFAAKVEGFSLTNQCGTPAYVAPEIIRKQPHGMYFYSRSAWEILLFVVTESFFL